MSQATPDLPADPAEIRRWIETEAERASGVVHGYQGELLVVERGGRHFLVKAVKGRGFWRWLNARMLGKEFRIYQRLQGLEGVPVCFGLIEKRFLLLELVNATSLKETPISSDDAYFDRLFDLIGAMHDRGVAHGDLKKKNNVLITGDGKPVLVDFGMSVGRGPWYRVFNNLLFDLARQIDINAFLKVKYGGYANIGASERHLYRRTVFERVLRLVKEPLRPLWPKQ